jgi:hypothetical protein
MIFHNNIPCHFIIVEGVASSYATTFHRSVGQSNTGWNLYFQYPLVN